MQTLSGRQLGGFSIGERLALGGMAAIYRATQISTEREVAVKVLPLHLAADPKLIARFEREARVLAALQHPHILPLIDFGREGDWLYLVTPLITQGDLAERLARWGEPLPLDEVGRIMRQLTDALDTAHRAGIVHRDLKPANVLLDARGNCLLSDFGIAKLEGAMGLTAAGTTLGTPEYMAPEQGEGRPVDARCDIYALGVILYELCTHRVPFEAESPTALLLKHITEPPPPPRRFNAKLPPELEHVILRALAKQPAARYPSAEAMGRAIAHAIPAGSDGATSTRETVVMRTVESAPTVVQPRVESAPTVVQPRGEPAREARRPGGANWAWASVLGVLLAAGAWWTLRERPVVAPPAAEVPLVSSREVASTGESTGGDSPGASTDAASPGDATRGEADSAPTPAAPALASPEQVASAGAYDDFDDAPFDGSFDPARWAATAGSSGTRVVQNGGVLRIETRAQFQGVYALLAPPPGRAPSQVQARVRLTGQSVAKQSSVGVTVSAYATGETQPRWWVSCYLYAAAGAQQATPGCTELGSTSYPSTAPSGITRWHALRFEFRNDRSVALSSDGAAVATMAVPAGVSGAGTRWFVSLIGWSEDGKPVAGEFDTIEID